MSFQSPLRMAPRKASTLIRMSSWGEGAPSAIVLLSDGAEPEYPERLASERHGHTFRPAALPLIERDRHVGLRQMKQGAQDILGHRYAMRTASAAKRHVPAEIGTREPWIDAGCRRLNPAQTRHALEIASRPLSDEYVGTRGEIIGNRLIDIQ